MAPVVNGLVERHDVGLHRGVLQDLLVHQALDFFDFGAIHGGVVGEIEAQPAGFHHAAGLLDVRAEHLAQRSVQQVRGGVVAPRGVAQRSGDFRAQCIADVRWAHALTMRWTVESGNAGEDVFDVGDLFA